MFSYVPTGKTEQGILKSGAIDRDLVAMKRVNFLWTAAHLVAEAQPNLSRSYL